MSGAGGIKGRCQQALLHRPILDLPQNEAGGDLAPEPVPTRCVHHCAHRPKGLTRRGLDEQLEAALDRVVHLAVGRHLDDSATTGFGAQPAAHWQSQLAGDERGIDRLEGERVPFEVDDAERSGADCSARFGAPLRTGAEGDAKIAP